MAAKVACKPATVERETVPGMPEEVATSISMSETAHGGALQIAQNADAMRAVLARRGQSGSSAATQRPRMKWMVVCYGGCGKVVCAQSLGRSVGWLVTDVECIV